MERSAPAGEVGAGEVGGEEQITLLKSAGLAFPFVRAVEEGAGGQEHRAGHGEKRAFALAAPLITIGVVPMPMSEVPRSFSSQRSPQWGKAKAWPSSWAMLPMKMVLNFPSDMSQYWSSFRIGTFLGIDRKSVV